MDPDNCENDEILRAYGLDHDSFLVLRKRAMFIPCTPDQKAACHKLCLMHLIERQAAKCPPDTCVLCPLKEAGQWVYKAAERAIELKPVEMVPEPPSSLSALWRIISQLLLTMAIVGVTP